MKTRALQIIVAALCALMLTLPMDADAKKWKRKGKRKPAKQEQVVEEKSAEEQAKATAAEPAQVTEPAAVQVANPAAGAAPAAQPAAVEPPQVAEPTAATEAQPATMLTEIKATSVAAPAAAEATDSTAAPEVTEETAVPAAAGGDALGVAVALKAGGTIPTSKLGVTYLFAGEVSYRPTVLDRLLGVAVELSFGQPGKSDSFAAESEAGDSVGGAFEYDLTERLLVLSLDAFATVELADISVYGGAGYGFYFLKTTVEAFGDTNTEAQARGGLQLRAGADYQLGPGEILLEARYHYTDLKFLSTGRGTNGGGVSVALGYRLGF